MGELVETATMTRQKPKMAFKKGCKGNPGGLPKLSFGGVVDVLAEMQWRLDHPNERAVTPPQKQVLEFYRKEFQAFVTQYTELRAARANEELAKLGAIPSSGSSPASASSGIEPSETDLRIDEAIDRVVQQLEELNSVATAANENQVENPI